VLPFSGLRVPSTQFGRALGFAGMGASLVLGTLKDNVLSAFGQGPAQQQQQLQQQGGSDAGGGGPSGSSSSSTAVYSNFITQVGAVIRG
jgi:hypothetical protein